MTIRPFDDGLFLPDVGRWSKQKHHFIGRYLDAFTTAMRQKWSEIHYVDLFAGAGFARVRDTGEIIAGSPVLAANTRFPFTQLHLVERDHDCAEALRSRLSSHNCPSPPQIIEGDANVCINEVLDLIPEKRTLTVALADPFGLHFDFETANAIADRRSDLIVLMADNMDALRNWAKYYLENPDSPLDRFMGKSDWRDAFSEGLSEQLPGRMRAGYEAQLRTLGYQHFAFERIENDQARGIYILLYASAHEAGIQIWNGISTVDAGGQRRLGF